MAINLTAPFATVGRAINPLFGGTNDMPTPTTVPLDKDTQQMIDTGVDRASRPGSEFASEINQGVAQNAGALGQSQEQAQQADQRLGGGAAGAEALRQVYSANSGNTIGRMMKANQYRGELAKADYMNQMSHAAMAKQRVATQNYHMLSEAYSQAEMARAQFVTSLFQSAQTGMGMYAAGKGAAKGMKEQGVGANYGAARSGGYAPSGVDYGGMDAGSIA